MVLSERQIVGSVVAGVDAVCVAALPDIGSTRQQSFDRRSPPQVPADHGAADSVDMAAIFGQGVNIPPVEIARHASSREGKCQMSQSLQLEVAVNISASV